MGGQEHTMNGLAGIGDLMLTCLGGLSRNKKVGIELGRGKKLTQILEERAQSLQGVAEGVATTPAAVKLATRCVDGIYTALFLLLPTPPPLSLSFGERLKRPRRMRKKRPNDGEKN